MCGVLMHDVLMRDVRMCGVLMCDVLMRDVLMCDVLMFDVVCVPRMPLSGKTVLAKAAAVDAGARLLVVNGPEVITQFYGESEAGLRGIFAAAAGKG